MNTEDVCPICIVAFLPTSKKYKTTCNHEFHHDCLYEWIQKKEECPMCRARVPDDDQYAKHYHQVSQLVQGINDKYKNTRRELERRIDREMEFSDRIRTRARSRRRCRQRRSRSVRPAIQPEIGMPRHSDSYRSRHATDLTKELDLLNCRISAEIDTAIDELEYQNMMYHS